MVVEPPALRHRCAPSPFVETAAHSASACGGVRLGVWKHHLNAKPRAAAPVCVMLRPHYVSDRSSRHPSPALHPLTMRGGLAPLALRCSCLDRAPAGQKGNNNLFPSVRPSEFVVMRLRPLHISSNC